MLKVLVVDDESVVRRGIVLGVDWASMGWNLLWVTLGNLLGHQVSIPMVDIGMAQLAMHSCFETMGSRDVEAFVRAVRACYESSLRFTPEGVALR